VKKSVVLLEVIISLILFSIIAIVSSKMVYALVKKNHTDTFIAENNLILETTRLFLSKKNDFTQVHQIDKNLYFNNNLLLENISKYESFKVNSIRTVNICIFDNSNCQVWKIKD